MIDALVCKRCSGALPAPTADSPFVACEYCGTTHLIGVPRMELLPQSQTPSDYERIKTAAELAWDHARSTAKDPVVALRAVVAARAHNLRDELEAERVARLAESLLRGFDTANKTETLSDKTVVMRMAEAASKCVIELRNIQSTEINLPFLTATTQGPIHLLHTVRRATLEQLDNVQSVEVREAAAPAPAPAPADEPKKKKKWWQFGE